MGHHVRVESSGHTGRSREDGRTRGCDGTVGVAWFCEVGWGGDYGFASEEQDFKGSMYR